MQKEKKQVKPLTPEQKKLKQAKQKRNAQIVCSIMLMFLGVITSPKVLGSFLQRQRFPQGFQLPSFMTYLGCTGIFMFFLTVFATFMRIFGRRSSPAQFQDPPSIVSVNEAIKNAIIYNLIFLGMYYYLSKNWKKDVFILEISPFILLGTLVFQFLMRLFELMLGAKGFRYLPQAITLFFMTVLTIQCFTQVPP